MRLGLLAQALAIGFSIAAPVGPIGVLCIRRTLAEGRAAGIATGLGAATADAVYGAIAGFGLTGLSSLLVGQRFLVRLAGGAFLLVLGVRTFLERPASAPAAARATSLAGAYASTFVLTLTNPMTILSFAAIFAGLGLGVTGGDVAAALTVVLGVLVGSAAWWLLLSAGVGLFRERIRPEALGWINRVSGAIIAGFGIAALASLLRTAEAR